MSGWRAALQEGVWGGAGDSMPQQPRGWGALKAQAASDSPATFMVGAASP